MTRSFTIIRPTLILGCLFSFLSSSAQDYYEGPRTHANTNAQPKQIRSESSRDDSRGFSIAVSVGAAVPFRSFSSTNVKNSFWDFNSVDSVKLQGFAKTGVHYNVTASYLFSDHIGIMAMFGSSSNSLDINTFSNTVGAPFTTSEGFHTREYLIGPYVSFTKWEKVTFEANAMIGLVSANYPAVDLTIVDTTETVAFYPGKSFGYSIGGAVKYNFTPRIAVSLNAAYTQAKMVYPGWSQTFTLPGYYPFIIQHTTDAASMPMGILRITAGIVYSFR